MCGVGDGESYGDRRNSPELIPLVELLVSGVPLVEADGVVGPDVLSTDEDVATDFRCDRYPFLNRTSWRGVVIFVYSSTWNNLQQNIH